MRSLLSLKEWLTLEEAADHLSTVFRERVSVADLYRFALGGHLTLSVNFVNHARARLGRKMRIRDAGFRVMQSPLTKEEDKPFIHLGIGIDAIPEYEAWLASDAANVAQVMAEEPKQKLLMLKGNQISASECIQSAEEISTIYGIWDLPMIGAERLDIEHALQQEIGGPAIELTHIDGAYVCNLEGDFAWIQEHFANNEYANEQMKKRSWNDKDAYYPAGGLPADAPIIVRVSNLLHFIGQEQCAGGGSDAPIDARERASLLRIIRALDVMAKLPERGAAGSVVRQIQELGFSGPAEATIRKTLNDARALEPNA